MRSIFLRKSSAARYISRTTYLDIVQEHPLAAHFRPHGLVANCLALRPETRGGAPRRLREIIDQRRGERSTLLERCALEKRGAPHHLALARELILRKTRYIPVLPRCTSAGPPRRAQTRSAAPRPPPASRPRAAAQSRGRGRGCAPTTRPLRETPLGLTRASQRGPRRATRARRRFPAPRADLRRTPRATCGGRGELDGVLEAGGGAAR